MLLNVAAVEPLPLVPAIRIEGKVFCGLPSAAARMRMWTRSNLRRGALGAAGASSWPRA